MGDYNDSIDITSSAAEVFAYLRDIENLPRYMPYLTAARRLEGDKVEVTAKGDPGDDSGPDGAVTAEAWMRVSEQDRRLEWGAPGPNDYSGSLQVEDGDGPQASRLTVDLHTTRAEGDEIREGLRSTLDGLKQTME